MNKSINSYRRSSKINVETEFLFWSVPMVFTLERFYSNSLKNQVFVGNLKALEIIALSLYVKRKLIPT